METLVLLLVILAIVSVFAVKLKSADHSSDLPYQQTRFLFTPAERSFLGVLDQAVGARYRIFGKVRVADLITTKRMADRSRIRTARNKIDRKHFDFVLCQKDDLSVIAVIELDDQSHQQAKRRERDAFLERVCLSVSLPLIRVAARRAYSVAEVREQIIAAIEPPTIDKPLLPEDSPSPEPDTSATDCPPDPPIVQHGSGEKPKDPLCPKCWSPTVRRKFSRGPRQGQEFWGCSRFPSCRGIVAKQLKSGG